MKKLISTLLAIILLLSLASFSACNSKADANTFSYLLVTGNNKYDVAYENNSQVDWWKSQEWLGEKITLDFMIPSKSSSATETMQTLIASGDYPDIIDYNAVNTITLQELYEDGVIMDISEYVESYMPNYLAYLENNPDIAAVATQNVDDEKLYLALYSFDDARQESSWSLSYRRDWLLKYGKNPFTGEAFTGGYDESGDWSDDIVFPCGEIVPLYLSDWEWMFEIFEAALEDLGLTQDPDSYCISIPYTGSDILSGLSGAFNTSASLYIDNDGYAKFGHFEDNIKVFYKAMNTWYKNGWLDKVFYERSGDQPYQVNMSGVAAGKVATWFGQSAFFGSPLLDTADPYLENAYVMAARPPLNDVYGEGTTSFWDAETNNFHNNNLYCYSKIVNSIVVSTKATAKNLPALFSMFDSSYSEEGSIVHTFGLNESQQSELQNKLYVEKGLASSYQPALTEGGEPILNAMGQQMYQPLEEINLDTYLDQAIRGTRIFGRTRSSLKYRPRPKFLEMSYAEMMSFIGSGYIQNDITGLFTAEETLVYNDLGNYYRNESETILYKFVTGELDVYSDKDWNEWLKVFDVRYKNGKTYKENVEDMITVINKINKK